MRSILAVCWLDLKEEVSSIATEVNPYEGYFHAIMPRLDQLENKLESLINKVVDEVKDGNEPKDLPLNEFFSTFCALKAWDENHPSAKGYNSSLNWFFRFLRERYLEVRSLRELTPIMISEYVKYHKGRCIFSKRHNQWEKLSERTINAHIKKLRHALETVDSRGTQELRERLMHAWFPEVRMYMTFYLHSDLEATRYLLGWNFLGSTRAVILTFFGPRGELGWSENVAKYTGRGLNTTLAIRSPLFIHFNIPSGMYLSSETFPTPIQYYVRGERRWVMFYPIFPNDDLAQTIACYFIDPTKQQWKPIMIFLAGMAVGIGGSFIATWGEEKIKERKMKSKQKMCVRLLYE